MAVDLYNTPREAVEIILPYIPKNVKTIWEPCCGNFKISEVLIEKGYNVISTDITDLDPHDFLSYEPDEHYDLILTNPPFSLKNKILQRCFELKKPFFLLLPLTSLETKYRGELYKKYGITLYIIPYRVQFLAKKSISFNTSWFSSVFGKNNKLIFL